MLQETHSRTLTKTVVYRVLSVIAIVLLALSYGAGTSVAGALGLGAIIVGSIAYYLHDRVWLKFSLMTEQDSEHQGRSLIKSITYRCIVFMIAFALARMFLTDSNAVAASFTIWQMVINFTLYYFVERVFNKISWGKKIGRAHV